MQKYQQITSELDDGILTVTLNRPEKLNAYSLTMGKELRDTFEGANENENVRVVIVTGAGRGFCAGADISAGSESLADRSATYAKEPETRIENRFVDAIFNCSKPSIAAINGPAVGVGITMTLPMDIRIMSDTARFGFVFARRGLIPEAGSSWFLPRIVGLPQALRWCLEAKLYDSSEALRGGLVSEITSVSDCVPRARAIARAIADGTSAVSIALTRHLLTRSYSHPLPTPVLELDSRLVRELSTGQDLMEGVRAFAEKREPEFLGTIGADMPASFPWWTDENG
jgi:enoyl-CoA hydratase/carnithine racemase